MQRELVGSPLRELVGSPLALDLDSCSEWYRPVAGGLIENVGIARRSTDVGQSNKSGFIPANWLKV